MATQVAVSGKTTVIIELHSNRMQPNTTQDWLAVATARAADADAIVTTRRDSIGSVYMAGYAVECSLKAYLKASRRPFPITGRAGHDLTALWGASGFSKRDIGDTDGSRAFYLANWKTSLRYELATSTGGLGNEELLAGARAVAGWLHAQARRVSVRRGARR